MMNGCLTRVANGQYGRRDDLVGGDKRMIGSFSPTHPLGHSTGTSGPVDRRV